MMGIDLIQQNQTINLGYDAWLGLLAGHGVSASNSAPSTQFARYCFDLEQIHSKRVHFEQSCSSFRVNT
jgi:hypothetical protein